MREERERRWQALREEMEHHKATCEGCERCEPPRAITAAPGDDVRVSRFRAPAQPTAEQHAAALALLGVGTEVPRGEAEPQDERDAAELQAARAEAQRRIDVRDRQAARSAAHEKQVKEERAAIEAAIAKRDIRERNIGDGKGSDRLDGLDLAWLECNPPLGIDEQHQVNDQADERALPPPPAGPPTLSELEAVRQRIERTGDVVLAEQGRALCDAARETGIADASVLATCDPRLVVTIAWERTDRTRQQAWLTAPSRRAQPGEPLDVLTARVLVERGRTRFDAIRLITGMTSAEAKDSWIRKRVDREVKAQATLAAKLAAPLEDEELSPEAIAELDRLLAESERTRE